MSLQLPTGAPLNQWQRLMLCWCSLAVLCGLLVSFLVTPDPAGFGTHQQWGLPPCSFRVMFGIPCPSCGGTTSFAHFVRGQWLQAWQANAAGFLGAFTCTLFVPWGLLSSFRGRFIGIHSPLKSLLSLLTGLTCVALVHWLVRLSDL